MSEDDGVPMEEQQELSPFPSQSPVHGNPYLHGGASIDALARAAKRPGKRPARAVFRESYEEEEGPEDLDLGQYLGQVWGMSDKDQILYCRAYASMLAARRNAVKK